MKKIICILALCLIALWASTPAFAAKAGPSEWAGPEIEQALDLEPVPLDFLENYHQYITRSKFCDMALTFVATQYSYDVHLYIEAYYQKVRPDLAGQDLSSFDNSPFMDTTDSTVIFTNLLGIVDGRGDRIFAPDRAITRQEAAVMFANTYKAYAGEELPPSAAAPFSDENLIAPWAVKSVRRLQGIGVLPSGPDNLFDPFSFYTWEQCNAIFVRLYQQGPVSRGKGNVRPLRTYNEEIEYAFSYYLYTGDPTYDLITQLETDDFTILYTTFSTPHGGAYRLWLVNKSGGCREIMRRIRDGIIRGDDRISLEDLTLNEDGTKLTITDSSPGALNTDAEPAIHEIDLKSAAIRRIR
jgi:hypothetical protein